MNRHTTAWIVALLMSALWIVSCGDDDDDNNDDLGPTPPIETGDIDLTLAFPNLQFDLPVLLTHSGDGSGNVFVVEKPGRIRAFDNSAAASQTISFLDITDRVNSSGNEEGLLGLAFHPQFSSNGYFYVYYSASSPRRSVISRFETGGDGLGNAGSEQILLEFSQPFSNHNGGMMAFGPDGMLYIGSGDGGGAGDPERNGQDVRNLLGKMLRIDVDNTTGALPYGIPGDNPYLNVDAARDEIYAIGLRNPWRFSFDRATGSLWAADVGQNQLEEVDIIENGGNYGWAVMEGDLCFESANCDEESFDLPVAVYERNLGKSITGGYVYRGMAAPSLTGKYLFGDYLSGMIWYIDANAPESGMQDLMETQLRISSFGEDADGEVYVLNYQEGTIYKFVQAE